MPYNANDRVSPDDMGTVIMDSYRERLVNILPWLATVLRDYQGDFDDGVRQVDIPTLQSTLTPSAPAATNPARNAAWGTPSEDSIVWDTFIPDTRVEASRKIADEDYKQLPTRNILDAHGISIARTIAEGVNGAIRTEKFSTRAVAAANVTKHSAADKILDTGVAAGAAAKDLYDAIDMYDLFAMDNGFGQDSATPFTKFAFMDGRAWKVLKDYLLSQNYGAALNLALLEDGGMFGINGMVRAIINGVRVVVTSDMPIFNDGSDNFRQVLFTTNRDTQFATLAPVTTMITPDTPPSIGADGAPTTGPMYAMWVREKVGAKGVDDRYGQIHQFRVD